MSTQPVRSTRGKEKPPEPRSPLAAAFDRDAAALAFLSERNLISRQECRRNLQRLGVELEDEEARRLPVPTVVARIPAEFVRPDAGFEPVVVPGEEEEAPVDEDRWFDQFADETEG